MAANALTRSVEADTVRLEDYLDDKLQSASDFDNLDGGLLANVEVQRSQLQAQLDDAIRELEDARRAAEDHQGGLARAIEDFEGLQQSIDARMKVVAGSTAPDEAIRQLERPMAQLHKVDLAYQYVVLLQDIHGMRSAARSHLPHSPKAALEPYSRLRQLATRMRELRGAADDAAAHLTHYVEKIADNLWDEMKTTMSREMEGLLKKRNWPQGIDTNAEMDEEWLQCFEKLVDLQTPEVLLSDGVFTLLPFEVMVKPFVQWFRFQFMGTTATSSPQSFGTFCIPQFISLIEKWESFFRENVGYILVSKFGDTETSVYMDPACALVTALLPVMREKVNAMVRHGVKNPQFLSSLMVQLMNMDDEIRSRFHYDGGGDPERGWGGLTSEVLDGGHFDDWLKAEKDFALERYHAIVNSPDARNIDYDYSTAGKMKPTFGAVRVTDLLSSVTSQYERVRRFSHKLKFLIEIQLNILDDYHDRLKDSLDTYYTLTSTLGRAMHGVTKEQAAALEGTGALETLCKVLGSSDHIVATLRGWSNEEFFVTFWEELQTRARRNDEHVTGDMTHEHVKDRISEAVGSDGDDGMLFDETIAAYRHRRQAAEEYLVSALGDSHQKAFRPYLSKPQWTTVNDIDLSQLAVTPELDEPLKVLKRNLTFLASALSTAVYRRVWREALYKLQDMLWTNVLMAQNFTSLGAAQLARDLEAILAVLDRNLPVGGGGSPALGTLQEGVRLLSLPLEADDGDGVAMMLQQASDRIFKDNTEAKNALAALEMDAITPAHARKILQRRVDAV
ncbi:RINT-1 family protein [Xylariaceae sp. FL0804]|nr:RINT-1 family protein [Xylariaceae sp. FL0804]